LKYDYRFVNDVSPFNGYSLTNRDTLRILVSKECDNTFTEIDKISGANHTPTTAYRTRAISLRQFANQIIKIRFLVNSEINTFAGYFVNFDNITYQSICPTSFGATANIKKANAGRANGSIAVKVTRGTAPIKYSWSTGAVTDSIGNIGIGIYTVTMTDANGCTDVQTYTVDVLIPTFETGSAISKVDLRPNPTSENALLDVELSKITDARVQVINMVGQVLSEQISRQTDKAQFELDLSGRPAGVYLVRITADNKTHVARLVKQ
jgi:Secretion system C-terminal sorting domain